MRSRTTTVFWCLGAIVRVPPAGKPTCERSMYIGVACFLFLIPPQYDETCRYRRETTSFHRQRILVLALSRFARCVRKAKTPGLVSQAASGAGFLKMS